MFEGSVRLRLSCQTSKLFPRPSKANPDSPELLEKQLSAGVAGKAPRQRVLQAPADSDESILL